MANRLQASKVVESGVKIRAPKGWNNPWCRLRNSVAMHNMLRTFVAPFGHCCPKGLQRNEAEWHMRLCECEDTT